MHNSRRSQFIHSQISWMIGTILVLTLLNSLTTELFFVLSLIGLLIIVELTSPFRITPVWRKRLWVLIIIGLLGFAIIVVRRILDILPPGVV